MLFEDKVLANLYSGDTDVDDDNGVDDDDGVGDDDLGADNDDLGADTDEDIPEEEGFNDEGFEEDEEW